MISLSFLFWVPCPSRSRRWVPYTPYDVVLCSDQDTISYFPRDVVPCSDQDTMSYCPRDVDPHFLQDTIACSPCGLPSPLSFEPLFPALLVAISLTCHKTISLTLHSLLLSLRFYPLLSLGNYFLLSSSLDCHHAYL